MNMTGAESWERFKKYYIEYPSARLALDISKMNFQEAFFSKMEKKIQKAFKEMSRLEAGHLANVTEKRMVGHYWLRTPELAPTIEIRRDIENTISKIKEFTAKVHSGEIKGQGGLFKNLLVIGIGGSALGPQFAANALSNPSKDKIRPYFIDNTDPDGIDRILQQLEGTLNQTLCIVISKSGTTKETRNGMLEVEAVYKDAGLDFPKHAVAITQLDESSALFVKAKNEDWLELFPMWEWVGGRTSQTSAVGLLPAALQGINIDQLLAGARACDELTRVKVPTTNPAALMALMWYYAGNGKGNKNMVVLPYKDRLEFFSKYLQQLVMESLGKAQDLRGKTVHQGLTVYGNKGSTDQHAYVQQLRDGRNDFFTVFIEVLKDRDGKLFHVEPDITSGDYLSGFYLGTRRALFENGRESITVTIKEVSPFTIGVLIALFERAVGLYALLININAYDQPGVEAGKKAATRIIELQKRIFNLLRQNPAIPFTVEQISTAIITEEDKSKGITPMDLMEDVFKICEHLSANQNRGIIKIQTASPFEAMYELIN